MNKDMVHRSFEIRTTLLVAIFFLLQAIFAVAPAEEIATGKAEDQEVTALFRSVEGAFRNKRVQDIVANLHRDFSYIMTYNTDGAFTALESDIEQYRKSVGSFFQSDPEIIDYTIIIEGIERSDEEIMVLARIKSVVRLNGIVNACDAASNYSLLQKKGRLIIKDVRGDATCSNTRTE